MPVGEIIPPAARVHEQNVAMRADRTRAHDLLTLLAAWGACQ